MIVNPVSGCGQGRKTGELLRQKLTEKNVPHQLHHTRCPGHATELARELCARADCAALCAVGGDGTFFEVLAGMDPAIPLSLIPAGTGNDFVHGAGLESDPLKALEGLLSGKSAPFDYIQVNDRRCLNGAGLGFDIDVLENESRFRRYIRGRASYYFALIRSLFHFGGRRGHVVLDGSTEIDENLFMLSVMNGKYIGGGMPISPFSRADDGVLDVVVIRMMPKRALPRLLMKYLSGRIQEETKYVSVYHCTCLSCRVEPASGIQLDGEIQAPSSMEVRLVPGGIRLFGKSA